MSEIIVFEKSELQQVIVDAQNKLQWLILPEEAEKKYTMFGDGREGDASELVSRVNSDPALNGGHNDWRLPTLQELNTIIRTEEEIEERWYWSSWIEKGKSMDLVWYVYFQNRNERYDLWGLRNETCWVRLVRSCG